MPDVGRWRAVIDSMLSMTGAAKGILALREGRSAEFLIPTGVLESPLIVNFAPEFVHSFVETYIAHDPWTAIEQKHHPARPYPLSRHLPPAELRARRFWDWLEPQGIDDTVVVDIGNSGPFWVGLNLYFDSSDDGVAGRCVALLDAALPALRTAWQIGEAHRAASIEGVTSLEQLSHLPWNAFFCGPDGRAHAVTKRLRQLAGADESPLRAVEPSIRFKDTRHQKAFERLLAEAVEIGRPECATIGAGDETLRLTISRVREHEDAIGRRTEQYLGTIGIPEDDRRQHVADLAARTGLTARERELFEFLRAGDSVRGFARRHGLSAHGADYHWRNLKKKLGINSPRDLHDVPG